MTELLELEKRAYLTRDQVAERRRMMDADVWLFIKWVCGHGEKAVERFHRPLAYFLAGDAMRLAASLEKYDSELGKQLKSALKERGIDWRTRKGIKALARALQRVNDRISRSMSKTTKGLDGVLWLASRNPDVPCDLASASGPDMSIAIASKSDPVAQVKMLGTVGGIMKTDAYAMYYGDRLHPKNPEAWINKEWILMAGRTKAGDQKTIEARGINSQWTANHYDVIYADDIVGTESGEASTDDAIRWMAAIFGVSKAPGLGGTRHIFNGTIYGPKDDNAVLVANDEFISVRVPVWIKNVPSNVENILVDGIPVLEEWYTVDDIRRMRKETLAASNSGQGAISWLQNFELTAHEEGAMQFTADLLKKSRFVWAENRKTGRREIRRHLWNSDKSPKINASLKQIGDDCDCWKDDCHDSRHEFVQFDPLDLPRTMGVDQALATGGDDWGVGCTAIDPFGFMYQLKGRYDNGGYWQMVPAIPMVFNAWGGIANPPKKIGMESNVWQSMSADWIKRDEALRFLSRRIEKLPPTQTAKVVRIFNDVYANLKMGTLLRDPEDITFERCALKYNGAEPETQWDDPLDCVAMSIQLHKTVASSISEEEMDKLQRIEEQNYMNTHDLSTGIDLSDFAVGAEW